MPASSAPQPLSPADDEALATAVGACVRTLVALMAEPHRLLLTGVDLEGQDLATVAREVQLDVPKARFVLDIARQTLVELLTLACAGCPHAGCSTCVCDGCAAKVRGVRACATRSGG